jgi:hypothetical protein
MSRSFKRVLTVTLALMMAIIMILPASQLASASSSSTSSVFYYQRDSKWGYGRAGYSACYLTAFAMIITNMGQSNATPADIYRVNNYSSYIIQSRITSKYNVSWNRTSVYGKSQSSKIKMVKELLEKYPQGVIVRNSGHTMIATRVNSKGTIIFNDPAYPNGDNLTMSQTQLGSWSVISYIETIS